MSRAAIFETLVGVAVIAVAALFLGYAYDASGRSLGRGSYELDAVFGRVDGVTVGSEVRMAGVKIGAVSKARLDELTYEARLGLAINSDIEVPDDSIAKIVSDGLIGGAIVSIEPGASETMLAAGGQIIQTQGAVDLLGLAVQAFTAPKAGDVDAGSASADGMDSLPDLEDIE
jgi:phospholipid/cholesterol/gamma-HCH transport system substrate-binding protein